MKKKSTTQQTQTVEQPQTDEWQVKYMRVLADYQNLEKRSSDQVSEARKFAAEMILLRMLPVVDTFGKVKAHIQDMGFDLAYKELLAVLAEQGVTQIKVVGEQFDPHTMECIEVVAGRDNEVVEELLPGPILCRVTKTRILKRLDCSSLFAFL